MPTALVIHGHFYQPPRENPWTHMVEREPGAEPFHDWNERIYSECYRPNAYARVFDDHGHVVKLVNNYGHLSFNFGPTLMSWIEHHHPLSYSRILAADRESTVRRSGHGNAIAQGYNHAILPLLDARDRVTQVRWGLADFKWRFQRAPESMWLPETAANDETLSTLIDEGLRFVILSPYQALRVRRIGSESWQDVQGGGVDCGMPYRYFHKDGSKRSIDIFFYDGPRSRAIAFEGALHSSRALIEGFARAIGGAGRIVSAATDGESYGHHFKFGDRCLAHALEVEAERQGFWVTNFGEFLDRNPPTWEAQISLGADGRGTSWSCAHGVGRWFRDCGCHTGGQEGWNQRWRTPLKEAFDFLRDAAARVYETLGGDLLTDPWAARNAYIEVLLDPRMARAHFFEVHAKKRLDESEQIRALALLEMQRHTQLTYTSCGWFFSDISGIETLQCMKYAARALDLMEELEVRSPREEVLGILSEAVSNKKAFGTGADIFRKLAEPVRVTPRRVSAHIAMTTLVDGLPERGEVARFTYWRKGFVRQTEGRISLLTGELILQDIATTKTHDHAVCAFHFGGVDFYAVVKDAPGARALEASVKRLTGRFPTVSLPAMLRLAQDEFGPDEYGLEHVLPGGREHITEIVFADLIQKFSEDYARLYQEHRRTFEILQTAGFELPKELRAAAEFTLGHMFEDEIRSQHQSQDPAAYKHALEIATEVAERGFRIDRTVPSQIFDDMLNARVLVAVMNPSPENVEGARELIVLMKKLGLTINLESAQETVYETLVKAPRSVRTALEPLATQLAIAPSVWA
jgi:alpha-amylase/alpha-mannosidase (GH57 family)